jgi:hypothetical protein
MDAPARGHVSFSWTSATVVTGAFNIFADLDGDRYVGCTDLATLSSFFGGPATMARIERSACRRSGVRSTRLFCQSGRTAVPGNVRVLDPPVV